MFSDDTLRWVPVGGILPSDTSTGSPASGWVRIANAEYIAYDLIEAAATATGNGFTATIEGSEVASSTGALFASVALKARTLATTATTDIIGNSTSVANARWGGMNSYDTTGISVAASTAGRRMQLWTDMGQFNAIGAYARLKITTAGTSSGGRLAATGAVKTKFPADTPLV